MNIISIDLGTTNIKVSIYDQKLCSIITLAKNVHYDRSGDFVEFDCEQYFNAIYGLISEAAASGYEFNQQLIAQIVLTGQAESLIMLNQEGNPVHPAISWLDMRSRKECDELSGAFDPDLCYRTTGQPALIPTWPITKMLWMQRNKPDVFDRTAMYLLLKDYIIYRLCGQVMGDYSIYSFSHYYNITEKCYWEEILSYCGIKLSQLPPVHPSGTIAGALLADLADTSIGLTTDTKINIGTLDHFAGMIGTGNVQEGLISESAGTVLSIATLIRNPLFDDSRLPLNCGPFPNTYVLLPVCESGGFSLEWFKNEFLKDVSFKDIDNTIKERSDKVPPIFLPYLTGVNAPDFNEHASGVFFGIRATHDKYDFALAVMQGVACLLKKNIDYMENSGIKVTKIISTGGGAKSPLWTQIKSDITNQIIEIPENEEAPSLGAAMMGAVSEQYFADYPEAVSQCISIKTSYLPADHSKFQKTYQIFNQLYDSLTDVYISNTQR